MGMIYVSDAVWKTLESALRALGAEPNGSTTFARYWRAVGELEDYAAVAETNAEKLLVELMRKKLEHELRMSAPRDALHEDARGVEEFLESPRRRSLR